MASNPKIGKRLGSVIKLKPEMYQQYKELHAAVWPEVMLIISNCTVIDVQSKLTVPG